MSKRLMYISGLDVTVYRVRIVERAWIFDLDLRLMIGWSIFVALLDYFAQNKHAVVCLYTSEKKDRFSKRSFPHSGSSHL